MMRRFVQTLVFCYWLIDPYKYKKSSKIGGKFVKVVASDNSAERISKDIDRMFPHHKEGGAFKRDLDEHTYF